MEVVIYFEYLRGRQKQVVVKEVSVAGENVSDSFRYENLYYMAPHGCDENGLIWDDGHIPYHKLSPVVKEAVAGFAHVYSFGTTKCRLVSDLLERPILDLEDFKCSPTKTFKPKFSFSLPCHRFPDISCAIKNAQALYDWLMYHLHPKSYVKCPPDMTRHTSKFISATSTNSCATHADWFKKSYVKYPTSYCQNFSVSAP